MRKKRLLLLKNTSQRINKRIQNLRECRITTLLLFFYFHSGGIRMRIHKRNNDEIRELTFIKDFVIYPEGSVMIHMGNTKVLCNASVEERVPPFKKDSGEGWITAEYAMLPRATHDRTQRDIVKLKQNNRSVEIQRLIGRALRAVIDFEKLGERTITIDCDVIQADGGTRTASITGGYVALYMACQKLVDSGLCKESPLTGMVSAISVGIVEDELLLDLCYEEDSHARVDMNVVMTDKKAFVEVQGTGEDGAFSRDELNGLLDLAEKGNLLLQEQQKKILGLI
jgi:ribonuclease PH